MKLDLGCGPNKKPDHIGIDSIAFPGVDHVLNIGRDVLPFADGTVDEVHCSHFIEHLNALERIHCLNECYRVLRHQGTMLVVVPHWNSARAYGDPTHQWPPVSEFFFTYLSQTWRNNCAPHTDRQNWPNGYACDFTADIRYGLNPAFESQGIEQKTFAAHHYREAALELFATLTKCG